MSQIRNLLGQKFGRLTPIEQTDKRKNRKVVWKCHCDCGNICEVASDALTCGKAKSCGCLKAERMKYNNPSKGQPPKDITGQRFGHLVAIKRLSHVGNGRQTYNWLCQCDCGNTAIIEITALSTHRRIDCDECKNKRTASKGEAFIMFLLDSNSIPYQYRYKDINCIFPDTKFKAEFDFFVNNQYYIEFDGEQHYRVSESSAWKDKSLKISTRDAVKNQYCKDNNIPLIRIPYTHLKDLCIEDLQLETSQFIV